MTVVGLDDTDSRTLGMCTTYVADRLARRVRAAGGAPDRVVLVRLNPAVEHKTRGNAALAVHTDLAADHAADLADEAVDMAADDPDTNPGVVVADRPPEAVPGPVAAFARQAIEDHCTPERARQVADDAGFRRLERGSGRGVVGALAAVGAWRARGGAAGDWTAETVAYRDRDRWGTERAVDRDSVFAAAEDRYPAVWDTVDRAEGVAVCVPRTPCPVLYGIRGEDPAATRAVADRIRGEPVAARRTVLTNQGTDDHLRAGTVGDLRDGRSYRVDATVATAPETVEGGHVHLTVRDGAELDCVAFEPTKRFRDRVRALRAGDRVTVCGEREGAIKLEKFALRDPVETESVTPDCPDCGRSMSSAGRGQGYRCRDCATRAEGKVDRPLDRALEPGWYEVPPVARRHVAKPLVRGGFDAPTHPER